MGKPKIRAPRRIKTPDLIEIKFGTIDYVGKISCESLQWGLPGKWVKYTQKFL